VYLQVEAPCEREHFVGYVRREILFLALRFREVDESTIDIKFAKPPRIVRKADR
jgi:hypothetical protein